MRVCPILKQIEVNLEILSKMVKMTNLSSYRRLEIE